MNDRGVGGFITGFLLGALTGAVAALLLAPTSGEELRHELEAHGEEFVDEAERLYSDAKGQVTEVQERGRIVLQDNVKKAEQAVQDARQKLAGSADSATDMAEG